MALLMFITPRCDEAFYACFLHFVCEKGLAGHNEDCIVLSSVGPCTRDKRTAARNLLCLNLTYGTADNKAVKKTFRWGITNGESKESLCGVDGQGAA